MNTSTIVLIIVLVLVIVLIGVGIWWWLRPKNIKYTADPVLTVVPPGLSSLNLTTSEPVNKIKYSYNITHVDGTVESGVDIVKIKTPTKTPNIAIATSYPLNIGDTFNLTYTAYSGLKRSDTVMKKITVDESNVRYSCPSSCSEPNSYCSALTKGQCRSCPEGTTAKTGFCETNPPVQEDAGQ